MHSEQTRLAVFGATMTGGGAERVVGNLIQGLAARGLRIDLILARAEGPNLEPVLPYVRLFNLNQPRALFALPGLVRFLRREKPDILFSFMHFSNILALFAARLSGFSGKVVLSEHSIISIELLQDPTFKSRVTVLLARLLYPAADQIVCVSSGVAADLVELVGLDEKKVQVVYNPVITPEVIEKAALEFEHRWFKPGEPPVILTVGRLIESKGFKVLIRAFARLRSKIPARLLILGEGAQRSELEALVGELSLQDDVELAGFVTNPYPVMRKSSVFALSSRVEGLPTVMVEAMYFGIPIVATDCPTGPREILQGGRFGVLTPVDDVTALAESLLLALEGKTPRPSPESWRPFTSDVVIDQYLQVMTG